MISPWWPNRGGRFWDGIGSISIGPGAVVRNGRWVRVPDPRRSSRMTAGPEGSSEALAGEWQVVPQRPRRRRR